MASLKRLLIKEIRVITFIVIDLINGWIDKIDINQKISSYIKIQTTLSITCVLVSIEKKNLFLKYVIALYTNHAFT